jgi:DUF4097 and DUF4098 domain-containing protein YvlB
MSGTSQKRTLILACLVALSFASLAGADFRQERELAMGPGGTFELDADSGAIEVRGVDRDGVRVIITSSRDDIEERFEFSFEERGNDAVVTAEKRGSWTSRWFSGSGNRLRFVVEVQRDADLDLHTAGGGIEVDAIDGRVELHTSGGSVRVDDVDGDLIAKTSGGSIHAADIGGDATVKSSGGSLEIYDVAGLVEAHTSGGSVQARFTSGNANGGTLSTSGGSITAAVDPSIGLDIDAHTSGGRVSSDLPLTVAGTMSRTSLRGKLNGGGPALKLRTSGGSIRLRGE